ncbi:PP2C family protein-serine/threonine phosphatase [Phytomonospora sp. NPDC050363]|uniref:PP2C family protein-serine/threonine phosphatase n=1 Tax=Phytomonospora sp. NPDC050363 TaxID=3155642 RepID=UPI0033E83D73
MGPFGDLKSRGRWRLLLGRSVPFLLMVAIILADTSTPDAERYDRFLVAAPALAAATWNVAGTLATGFLAAGVSLALSVAASDPVDESFAAGLSALLAVTAAAAWSSSVRRRREDDLSNARAVADVAQRTVLRPLPSRLGSTAFHLLYEASAEEARIGGDFYKALRTPFGVRVILGDVQGKGLAAVDIAALLASAFREAAYTAGDLAELADALERSMQNYTERAPEDADRYATVLLAEIPEDRPVVRLLSCGHPPPLLLSGDDVAEVEFAMHSPAINFGWLAKAPHHVEELPFAPGDRLLMYTDGITEARSARGAFYPMRVRIERWRRESGDRMLALLHDDLIHFVGRRLDDDVAALLVTRLPDD